MSQKYVRKNALNSKLRVYHTDESCPSLPSKTQEVDERYIEWHELRECQHCQGTASKGAPTGQGHYEALKAAAENHE